MGRGESVSGLCDGNQISSSALLLPETPTLPTPLSCVILFLNKHACFAGATRDISLRFIQERMEVSACGECGEANYRHCIRG